ncbi:MAG: alpha/beta hydrolase [bacterium]|nr:alpha/beta hydrolase [bacterium]
MMAEPIVTQIPLTGYSVDADWYQGTSHEVLLVLIGYESKKAKYREMIQVLRSQTGTSALVLDYSGHGESPFDLGEIRPAQHFLEVVTVFDWLSKNQPGKSINVMGSSYGSFMATQLTKYRTFPKLMLRVPAIYPPNVFYDELKTFENTNHFSEFRSKSTEELVTHPLLKRSKEFVGKTMVVTHELDDICPPNETNAFIQSFDAEHWEAKGFKHGFNASDVTEEQKQEYFHRLAEWLK